MNFLRRTPPTPTDERIAELERTVARLQIDLGMQEVFTANANKRAEEAANALIEAREQHRIAMAACVPIDSLAPGDMRRLLTTERAANVALSNQLAIAERRDTRVHLGRWAT